ncbi:MAG: tetratricopeptide repeat protein [Anaerolineales bacterium]
MASSLQKGISAAKAGNMQKALDYLKDAIIEEPQNADVWVWIAAIIDDLDKQEIFLEKALEIDPNNIPAQRGLAYLQKRKRDETSAHQNEHLSDHTHPISPFPPSQSSKTNEQNVQWPKLNVRDLERITGEQEAEKKEEIAQSLPKLSPLEIGLLAVVVLVFCFIGLLAASALFDFELPLGFLKASQPNLEMEPPYAGVFLYENNAFFDIQMHQGPPSDDVGIPTSFVEKPIIVFWQTDFKPDQIKLIYETGEYMDYGIYQGKNNTDLIQPESPLQTGLYCLLQFPDVQSTQSAFYWCFKVQSLN